MKKIKFKYNYLVFLYAYLRQTDLSLDRSRWGKWVELTDYYKDRIQPITVAESLQKNSVFKPSKIVGGISEKELNFWDKCSAFIVSAILGICYLTEEETQYCYQLLIRFDEFLHMDMEKYTIEMEKLRVDVAKFYAIYVLEFKLTPIDRNRAEVIECFLQSENITPVQMNDFIKGILL